MLKITFQILTILLFNLLLIGKLFIFGRKKSTVVDKYVAFITFILGGYCINAILLLFEGTILNKLFFLLFAASPFIIGKLISYKTINFYTNLQLFVILFSGFYSIYF